MKAIVAGTDDHELGEALETEGVEITRVEGIPPRPQLEEAGITETDTFVLTDAAGATAISIAKDLNEDVQVVVYADDSVPDFARGQADLIIDPSLLSADAVAEELSS